MSLQLHSSQNIEACSCQEQWPDRLTTRLNQKLDSTAYGPIYFLSDVTANLKQLQKKKPNKAVELQRYLAEFAADEGILEEAFDQWPTLLPMKARRDRAVHSKQLGPADLTRLQGQLGAPDSQLKPAAAAVASLIMAAKKELGLQ